MDDAAVSVVGAVAGVVAGTAVATVAGGRARAFVEGVANGCLSGFALWGWSRFVTGTTTWNQVRMIGDGHTSLLTLAWSTTNCEPIAADNQGVVRVGRRSPQSGGEGGSRPTASDALA